MNEMNLETGSSASLLLVLTVQFIRVCSPLAQAENNTGDTKVYEDTVFVLQGLSYGRTREGAS